VRAAGMGEQYPSIGVSVHPHYPTIPPTLPGSI